MKLFDADATTTKPVRDARLTAINFVGDAINRTLDLREIADNALHAILSVIELDAGAVYIWQDGDKALQLFACRGISEAFARQVATIAKGADVTIDAVLEGATKVIEDFTLTPRMFQVDVVRAGFSSAVMCPIRTQGFVVGMLALGTYKPRAFRDADVDLIEVISNQIGNAMVHAQLQSDLRASEEQYRALVENSDDAIYIAGPDARPRYANTAFERILGYTAEELAGLDSFERIHPDDVESVRAALGKIMDGQSVHNLEYRFCRKDGQWIDLQCNASVFARDGNQVEEFQFVVREITQLRQRQQQLVRRNRQLSALTTLAAVANSSLKIEEIARNTLQVALESTGMEAGSIHLADAGDQRLHLYIDAGLPAELVEQMREVGWGEGVPGVVAATGQPRVFTDLGTEAPAARPAGADHGFKSLIVVPVKAKGEVLGTLGLISKRDIQLGTEAVEMVTAMGNQLGIAIANARLYEAQLLENEKLSALVDVSVGSSEDLDSLLQQILQKSATLLTANGGYLVRHVGDESHVVATTAEFQGLIGTRFPIRVGLSGQIRELGRGKIFTREEAVRYGYSAIVREANMRSVLMVPLVARGESIGALALVREAGAARDFSAADLELMGAFASRAAVAIDNAQLLQDLSRKNELLELLIEEAHHRIKNNLQMISGLLQLESDSTQAGTAPAKGLPTAISRIQAIAQVHNLLSQEMPEKVDTRKLLAAVVEPLRSATPAGDRSPLVQLDLTPLWLNADQSVAVALVVNELVSNSLLHGKPPAEQTLTVAVRCRQESARVILTVCDNGGGLAPGKDWRAASGQGMNIVSQLAQVNLRGELHVGNRDGGLCAELRFEVASLP